jgi:hypothetical protein
MEERQPQQQLVASSYNRMDGADSDNNMDEDDDYDDDEDDVDGNKMQYEIQFQHQQVLQEGEGEQQEAARGLQDLPILPPARRALPQQSAQLVGGARPCVVSTAAGGCHGHGRGANLSDAAATAAAFPIPIVASVPR